MAVRQQIARAAEPGKKGKQGKPVYRRKLAALRVYAALGDAMSAEMQIPEMQVQKAAREGKQTQHQADPKAGQVHGRPIQMTDGGIHQATPSDVNAADESRPAWLEAGSGALPV